MSLFQCDNCGCLENTSCTNASRNKFQYFSPWKDEQIHEEAKKYLGLSKDEELGSYCSACTPIWYDDKHDLRIGKNPNPEPGKGLWHGKFDRIYLPKGEFETAPNGNLRHKKTLDEEVEKFAIKIEKY